MRSREIRQIPHLSPCNVSAIRSFKRSTVYSSKNYNRTGAGVFATSQLLSFFQKELLFPRLGYWSNFQRRTVERLWCFGDSGCTLFWRGISRRGEVAYSGFRRIFGKRMQRGSKRRAITKNQNGSMQFSVATYNLRGVMDRWKERKPLLRQCLQEMDADVLCFQECLTGECGQDRELLGTSYHIFACKSALYHLMASKNAFLRGYAKVVTSLLALRPMRQLMVSAPQVIESFRERFYLDSSPYRILRDMSLAPFFGNSVACRLVDAHEIKHSTLLLGHWRAAQRIEFRIGENNFWNNDIGSGTNEIQNSVDTKTPEMSKVGNDGLKIWVVNTHLDHEHPDNRQSQASKVVKWMESVREDAAVVVLCGDFNGAPHEPFHTVFRNLGYRSGYLLRHGKEPDGTWPTGIQAPLMDYGEFECLDYVYVWAADGYKVTVLDASLHGNKPDLKDPKLYPSDHAAIKVTLNVERYSMTELS